MACPKRIDKNCVDCGVLLVGVVPGKKYCFECGKKRSRVFQRAYQREYRKVIQEKRHASGASPLGYVVNPYKKYCEGCSYWGGGYKTTESCNYIFVEGHSRGCPPGKGCTERVTGKKLWIDWTELG